MDTILGGSGLTKKIFSGGQGRQKSAGYELAESLFQPG
jgi:hypothetical protein